MPDIICFANMKGGVGKTTLCINLAFELFRSGKKVLVVDNDPQFNATSALLKPDIYIKDCIKSDKYLTTYNLYEKQPRIRGSKRKKIDPSKLILTIWYLRDTEYVLDLMPSRIELYETLRNPSQKEYMLDKFLSKHAINYDYIFIDCPPTPSVLTLSAFAASDYVLIPVTPDFFATMGLPQFLGTLKDFKDDLQDNHDVTPLGVIFTNVERKPSIPTINSMNRVREAIQKSSEDIPILKSKMTHLKVYEKSLWQSVPVQKITGIGQRGKTAAVLELMKIADELGQLIAQNKEELKNGE